MKSLSMVIGLSLGFALCLKGYAQTSPASSDLPMSINAGVRANGNSPVAIILPSDEKPAAANERIAQYARVIRQRFFSRAILLNDRTALKENLSNDTIISYGTPSGNLWVRQNLKGLPIKIESDKIVTDRTFKGTDLRLITCWFNPENPAKPWIIYTAQQAKDVVGINSVFHGPTQFTVSEGTKVLENGFYAYQGGTWKFSRTPDFEFPVLTRKQMYEDYDAFTNIVDQVFPLMEVNRQIYGIDIPKLLTANRLQISHLSTTAQFADLINRTITACRGSHFWMSSVSPQEASDLGGFFDKQACNLSGRYLSYLRQATRGRTIKFPLLYFKGNYYTLCDFAYNGIAYSRGMKVFACDGLTPDAIVSRLTLSGVLLQWDYDLKKYVDPEFYKYTPGPNAKNNSPLTMELEKKNGGIVNVNLNSARLTIRRGPGIIAWDGAPLPPTRHTPLVALVDTNILYIRLPSMDRRFINYYRNELPKYKSAPIQKVVIDIRDNGGGSDAVWKTLLSFLLDKKMILPVRWAVKQSDIIRKYMALDPRAKARYQSAPTEKIGFLNNEEFKVLNLTNVITPETNSLRLDCKFYVLADNIYSSAGGFMSICKSGSQLISVGLPNRMILGLGSNPLPFSLPNSELTFTVEPVLDLTDAKTVRDTQHVDVDVRITPTLEQLLDYYNTGNNVPLQERLNEHDPFFEKVLQLN